MFKYLQRLAIFAITFFVLSGNSAIAELPTPALLCLSVQDDGSLKVTWDVGSGTFDGVRAYFKDSGNPEQPFDFPSPSSPGIITVTDATVKQYEVELVTYAANIESPRSQKFRTINPNISPKEDNSITFIEWSPGNNTITGKRKVYYSIDNIDFNEVGETSANIFRDTIEGICTPTNLYYYVEFTNDNCSFRSMTGSVSGMLDKTAPKDPIFEYVTIETIDDKQIAVLYWSLDNAPGDLHGYQIEISDKSSGGGGLDHATVGIISRFPDDPLLYPDNYQNPCVQVVGYILKAFDGCLDPPNSSAQHVYEDKSIHNTILLEVDLEAECNRKATLTWNKYNNMSPPVLSYFIYRSEGEGGDETTPEEVAELTYNDESYDENLGEFTFKDAKELTSGQKYTYHIEAKNANLRTSKSCRVKITPDHKTLEKFDLDYLTVLENNSIQLVGNVDLPDNMHEIAIYRSATIPDAFELLRNTSWDYPVIDLSDPSAKVNETAYYYQLVALDECGYVMDRSTVMRSIHLELEDQGDGDVRLNWNAFEGWDEDESPVEYEIFRMTNDNLDTDYPQPVINGALVFNDFINPVTTNGRVTYYIEAIKNKDNGKADEIRSRSNEVLFQGEAEVLMPNAFRPESDTEKNRIFTPIVKNVESTNYRFVIYNRWGQLVFETNDSSEGWDGSKNGSISPSGIYAYLVVYSDYNGITHSQRGAVNLLR